MTPKCRSHTISLTRFRICRGGRATEIQSEQRGIAVMRPKESLQITPMTGLEFFAFEFIEVQLAGVAATHQSSLTTSIAPVVDKNHVSS
jgi:hypothetical protein